MVLVTDYFDFTLFSCHWSEEAAIDIKLVADKYDMKENTSTKNLP